MSSSQTITIFSDRPDLKQRSSSFVVSILVHIAALALLTVGVIYNPEIDNRVFAERFSIRHIDLHPVEPQLRQTAGSAISYPGPRPVPPTPSPSSSGKPKARPSVLRRVAQAKPGPQTLVQPNVPSTVTLKLEVPVPTVMIWTPEKTLANAIVAPLPEKPTASDLQPSFDPPNEEVNLADVEISSTGLSSQMQHIFAGTTSPVVVHGPESVQLPPATVSNSSAQPTPAAVLSISDLRMTEGTVSLPPVNETKSSTSPGALAPGPAVKASHPMNQAPANGASGTSPVTGSGNPAHKTRPTGVADARSGANILPAKGVAAGAGDQSSTVRIALPHDGQFGAVVVGASLEEQFPEMTGLWTGRLAYTVYLHVGLAKSWILQYSVPSSVDAAAGGNITRLEAPWPYNIVRPNITPGEINADALMIRGFVNQEGRFEALAVVFPPEFPHVRFVLDALQQWQFRPAQQNGQVTKVEVLLIIPE